MFTHRALVTYSSPITGEVRVKIPAVTGIDELSVSYFGREAINNIWQVPSPGEEVIVSSDDENMTNLFLLSANPLPPPISASTGEPSGFPSRSDNKISFDNSTRTFTISPVENSYYVWCVGNRFTITSSLSVIIPNVTGAYYFYFDSTGTLQYSTAHFDIEFTAPVAFVYWRATSSSALIVADERHGIVMDWQTHEYLHRTRGAAYANGFGISNYTTNGTGSASSSLTLDIANGTFFDEDIEVAITHSATPVANTWQQRLQNGAYIPVFYRDANGWEKDTATQFPVKFAPGGFPYYNSGSTLVQMANNRYGVSWVVATNGLNEPIICIMGQAEYSNIADAAAVSWGSLSLTDLPIFEFRPLWKVIFQAQNSTYKAAIRDVIDLRTSVSNVTTTGAGVTTLDGLADVVITSPATNSLFRYNGTYWVNDSNLTIDSGILRVTGPTYPGPYSGASQAVGTASLHSAQSVATSSSFSTVNTWYTLLSQTVSNSTWKASYVLAEMGLSCYTGATGSLRTKIVIEYTNGTLYSFTEKYHFLNTTLNHVTFVNGGVLAIPPTLDYVIKYQIYGFTTVSFDGNDSYYGWAIAG